MLGAVYVFGRYMPVVLSKIPFYAELSYQPRDEIHLVLMLALLFGYGWIGHEIGSHLLGAFVAGMSFSKVNRSMFVWRQQMKRIAAWLVRLFFAATVAFSIPVGKLFSPGAFGIGLLFTAS